jgi:hypothetical protein
MAKSYAPTAIIETEEKKAESPVQEVWAFCFSSKE